MSVNTTITIEDTQKALQDWRATKTDRKQPIPQNIRYMIKQLLSEHSSSMLVQKLKIHSQSLNSIRLQSFSTDHKPIIPEQNSFSPSDGNNFIPFKIIPHNSTDNHSVSCQFVNKNGDKLTISTSNISAVIKAFLCCN